MCGLLGKSSSGEIGCRRRPRAGFVPVLSSATVTLESVQQS